MHPELLNNSLFLRYYRLWQSDPGSIVFAPIAEYLLTYGMIDDAIRICREGLKTHPALVSGHLLMAKIHLRRGNWEEAEEELHIVLSNMPRNKTALELMEKVNFHRLGEPSADLRVSETPSTMQRGSEDGTDARERGPTWNTVTMANIYASQGHLDQARAVLKSILSEDPYNDAARKRLESLQLLR